MENEKLNFNIVKMTESQVEVVARLEAQVFSTPWSKQALMDTLLEEHILFYTALADEDVAGYCGIYLAADEGEITNVAVAPPFRRHKVAQELLEKTMAKAYEKGARKIFLEVRSQNEPAIRLYQKAGFYQIGVRKNYYQKPQDDALVMMFQYADK